MDVQGRPFKILTLHEFSGLCTRTPWPILVLLWKWWGKQYANPFPELAKNVQMLVNAQLFIFSLWYAVVILLVDYFASPIMFRRILSTLAIYWKGDETMRLGELTWNRPIFR